MNRSLVLVLAILATSLAAFPAFARDAAFAAPGSLSLAASGGDAVTVEPKADVDTGDSIPNITRRTTIFFVNKTSVPVEVNGVSTNDDGNVKSAVVSDDCSREGKIAPASRCAMTVEATPSNPGNWAVEIMLTHSGPGRIARAKLRGKAAGQISDRKEAGFAISTKEVKPVDFGEVEVGTEQVARTALMVNDGTEDITLMSVDVIAAQNGLERLDQGCIVDMELKPGESCPITLTWKPTSKGQISTDLIIRHSGKMGFAVVPIRGKAKEAKETAVATTNQSNAKDTNRSASKASTPPPPAPTAEELAKLAADKIPPLDADALGEEKEIFKKSKSASVISGAFRLIGTVGNRAILLKPDGTTSVVGVGEDISYDDGKIAKLSDIQPKSADLFMDGKKLKLSLEAASELTAKAAQNKESDSKKDRSSSKKKSSKSSNTEGETSSPSGSTSKR